MDCKEITEKLKDIKESKGYTLFELSKKLDVQITTLARWFKTNKMNRVYASMIESKLDDL